MFFVTCFDHQKRYLDAGTLIAHIFITQLRQVVNHRYLVEYPATAAPEISEKICGICYSPAENQVVTACEHVFCKACLYNTSTSREKVSCPACSKPLTRKTTIKGFKSSSIMNRIQLENVPTSTQIEVLAFLMDPWWNPAVERQAQGRIDRIGQYKPMRIVRFIIEGTIEEKILKLQEQKERMVEGTVGGSIAALEKLDSNDMILLLD